MTEAMPIPPRAAASPSLPMNAVSISDSTGSSASPPSAGRARAKISRSIPRCAAGEKGSEGLSRGGSRVARGGGGRGRRRSGRESGRGGRRELRTERDRGRRKAGKDILRLRMCWALAGLGGRDGGDGRREDVSLRARDDVYYGQGKLYHCPVSTGGGCCFLGLLCG